jgi:hypothetical protein
MEMESISLTGFILERLRIFRKYVREDIWFLGQGMKFGTLDHAAGYYPIVREILWVE